MSDYRRAYVPGGCFFFTVVTYERQRLFAEVWNIDRLREGFRRTLEKHPFHTNGPSSRVGIRLGGGSWTRRTCVG